MVDPQRTRDRDAIDEVVGTFFATFTSGPELDDRMTALRRVLHPAAVVVRTCGAEPQVMEVEAFVRPRHALLAGGGLADFREWETEARTEVFGDVAQRWSAYAKEWWAEGVHHEGRGVKSIQLARTATGWRITAVAWDDVR